MLESAQCCASPATTPGSVDDEELLPKKPPQETTTIAYKIFYSQPFVILTISCVQVRNELKHIFPTLHQFWRRRQNLNRIRLFFYPFYLVF